MWPISLPDELLQVLSAELDAAAACRLSQVDKAIQHWILLHARDTDRVYAWRHASIWLMLCKRPSTAPLIMITNHDYDYSSSCTNQIMNTAKTH